MRFRTRLVLIVLLSLSGAGLGLCATPVDADAQLWRGLAQGHMVALMRHAGAPGVGDPDTFKLGDCSTQRNLSAAGRDQARAIGTRMRAQGIHDARVYSSQWCRCLDTARLLDVGDVVPVSSLNSFFENRADGAAQTAAVRQLIAGGADQQADTRPLVLVTHQVNITALADIFPSSGEILFVRPNNADQLEVVGRIRTGG